MTKVCPRCQQRYSVMPNSGDYVHECSGPSEALRNEDVKVIGAWSDYSGSGNASNVLMQGAENKVFGTRGDIEGSKVHQYTSRGNIKTIVRTRPHLEYIEGDDGKN